MNDNRTPIVVDGKQKMMLSMSEIVYLVKRDIYDYKAITGQTPTKVMVSYPVYHAILASMDFVKATVYKGSNGKDLFMGIPLEVVDSPDAFFMVGCATDCKVGD